MNDAAEYTRAIEAYLCRKNDGHLIRIVGPAFEQVCGWAARGVPLNVAYRGIDRYFERYYAKGPRRRPVRVEFCEADVLDVYDEWRRAVGVQRWSVGDADPGSGSMRVAETSETDAEPAASGRRHGSLPAHLERVIARLTVRRAGEDRRMDEAIAAVVQELDTSRSASKTLRGTAREALLTRLRELDAELLARARECCTADELAALERDADRELAPFRDRMPLEAYAQSRRACLDRLLRERFRLPVVEPD